MVYKSGQIFLPFCHNSCVWQTDRQTDRLTEFSSLDRVCIPCSAVIRLPNVSQRLYVFLLSFYRHMYMFYPCSFYYSFWTPPRLGAHQTEINRTLPHVWSWDIKFVASFPYNVSPNNCLFSDGSMTTSRLQWNKKLYWKTQKSKLWRVPLTFSKLL